MFSEWWLSVFLCFLGFGKFKVKGFILMVGSEVSSVGVKYFPVLAIFYLVLRWGIVGLH